MSTLIRASDDRLVDLTHASRASVDDVGGKAKALGRLMAAGLPVPTGTVLTTALYRRALQEIDPSLLAGARAAVAPEELQAWQRVVTAELRAVARGLEVAQAVRQVAGRLLARHQHVIVRSSGNLEDSSPASFAGVLDSIADISAEEAVLDAVAECWSSAFNPRIALYMREKGLEQEDIEVAVIIQAQVEAEKSGLVFGRDPRNRESSTVVIEALPGGVEELVSGRVTPERYAYQPDTATVTYTKPKTTKGGGDRRLTDQEVSQLAVWALEAERLFGGPQDMEWAFAEGGFWLLQSRPIVFSQSEQIVFPEIAEHTVLLRGQGVSPAVGGGRVRVRDVESLTSVEPGTVVVLPRVTSDIALQLRDAAAVVADEGGATSHGANLLRELGVPCVLGTGTATQQLREGRLVTVDGFRGAVYEGDLSVSAPPSQEVPSTRLQVYVSVLIPSLAAGVARDADGVSSLRNEHFLLSTGVHPSRLIRQGRTRELEDAIFDGLVQTCHLFAGRPVWYKTMDAPTDEFRRLAGGEEEPHERNPLLGWRGIGRELDEPQTLGLELRAIRRAVENGCDNLGVKLPFVRFLSEFRAVEKELRTLGLTPHEDVAVGISVETPAVAAGLEGFLEAGADFVSVGLSDLTMCMLGLDRESHRVARLFDPAHPAVIELLAGIAATSRAHGVTACVTGESAHEESVLPEILRLGFDAVGISLSRFAQVKRSVADLERAAGRDRP